MKYLALVAACLLAVGLASPAVADDPDDVGSLFFELGDVELGPLSTIPIVDHYVHPPLADGEVVHLDWTVTDGDQEDVVVTSGTGDWVIGEAPPLVGIPADATARRVRLSVHAAVDSASWGRLEGTATGENDLDVVGPRVSSELSSDVVFPVRDGYLDSIDVDVVSLKDDSHVVDVIMDVVDRHGVGGEFFHDSVLSRDIGFHGLVMPREALPAGRYTLRVIAIDSAGNAGVDTHPIRIDDRRRVERTFRQTIPAARTLAGQYVGACSRLGAAAGRGWKGSLGLYSTAPCAKKNGSVVLTVHGARLPSSVGDYPGRVGLSMYGGAARGSGRAYVVHGWLRAKDNEFVGRKQLNGRMNTHNQGGMQAAEIVRDIDGRHWVYWQLGLTAGSRYDVKSFTISAKYYALEPVRSRTANDAKTIAEPSGAPGPGYTVPKTDAAELLAAYKPSI